MRHIFFWLVFLLNLSQVFSQASEVDFTRLQGELTIIPDNAMVKGRLLYFLDVKESTDSIFIDAQQMNFSQVLLNANQVDFTNSGKALGIRGDFQAGSSYELEIVYQASPKQTMYFWGWDTSESFWINNAPSQVWTQGQGKYTSHWLPSFDDTKEKVEFDLTYIFPKGYTVIANGELKEQRSVNDSLTAWSYDMNRPMSSYLLAMVAGQYKWKELKTASDTSIYLYYYPQDEHLFEPTYRYTLEIFEFLEEEIGVAYPWQNYRQIPVHNFLHSGMENTGATVFSDVFITDSIGFKDRNYVMVNAHEMAHQWFGNMVTAKSEKDHWLQEGFSTYYALLAETKVFGPDYYYWKLFEWAEQLQARSDRGQGEVVMRAGGSSLTYYYHGAWVLHMLREKIGDEAFRQGVKQFLNRYQFQNASTHDFMAEMELTSGQDLSGFTTRWLKQSAFAAQEALESLRKSNFINNYLRVSALKEVALEEKKEQLELALGFPVNDYIGQQVVHQLALEDPLNALGLYQKAFETNNHLVRQAIATSMDQIPLELKTKYESLLNDESYLTKEAAFYNLWMNFPSDRAKYLQQLKGIEGFYDKNIEILWLALNLATPDFEAQSQAQVYEKLTGYTSPSFAFYVRRNAFQYLYQLNAFGPESLVSLVEACQHPVWQFRSFSRQLLQELIRSKQYDELLNQLTPHLSRTQRDYLKTQLEN